jgi:hypothetical protein
MSHLSVCLPLPFDKMSVESPKSQKQDTKRANPANKGIFSFTKLSLRWWPLQWIMNAWCTTLNQKPNDDSTRSNIGTTLWETTKSVKNNLQDKKGLFHRKNLVIPENSTFGVWHPRPVSLRWMRCNHVRRQEYIDDDVLPTEKFRDAACAKVSSARSQRRFLHPNTVI